MNLRTWYRSDHETKFMISAGGVGALGFTDRWFAYCVVSVVTAAGDADIVDQDIDPGLPHAAEPL